MAEPAFAMIAAGASADQGWRKALDGEIAGYDAADDEHFKARASDLKDIRDRVLAVLFGATAEPGPPAGAIIVGEDMTPSRFLATDWSRGGGIALTRGSASGHVATLARARGIPMIVGLSLDLAGVAGRREAFIDGENARHYASIRRLRRARISRRAPKLRIERQTHGPSSRRGRP